MIDPHLIVVRGGLVATFIACAVAIFAARKPRA
jgi:hypothetical protein